MLLSSLEVQGYRAFRSLRLERLGRVNLFVGRNNSGKSSLLEAVRIYAARGSLRLLWRILRDRDEVGLISETDLEQLFVGFGSFFHGREESRGSRSPIVIGPIGSDPSSKLRLALTWQAAASGEDAAEEIPVPKLEITFGERSEHRRLDQIGRFVRIGFPPRDPSLPAEHVPPAGVSQLGALWDSVALTPTEDMVIRALRFVSPDIERISIVGRPNQVAMAKLKGHDRPVPLGSLGDGVHRVLGIALSLANARNGVATFDEVDNGLHYSVQRQLWSLIFDTAHALNVQVFAVTHSWDCIEAFQHAAADDPHEQALLVRLDRERDGEIRPTLVNERELSVLTREHIEVR